MPNRVASRATSADLSDHAEHVWFLVLLGGPRVQGHWRARLARGGNLRPTVRNKSLDYRHPVSATPDIQSP